MIKVQVLSLLSPRREAAEQPAKSGLAAPVLHRFRRQDDGVAAEARLRGPAAGRGRGLAELLLDPGHDGAGDDLVADSLAEAPRGRR